ncbi:unnamed protein product [Periconia digitata]|uniref:Zn(2)-C6 fungal-type domain-containing protein n=1 Tax=Periconia digitata TaxID=1303443 RepID=A0A9W4UT16_9PLEO|nr:unnamed protein product [Periconia digitata]
MIFAEDMSPPKNGRGCWTCKERKVACDRQSPRCRACVSSGRICKGYGVRLSWPHKNDRKRAMVAASRTRSDVALLSSSELVNVFSSDIERLSKIYGRTKSRRWAEATAFTDPFLARNPSWTPTTLVDVEADLFSYYHNIVSAVLTSMNDPLMRNLVLRMCFSDGTSAATAIIYSICALASMHRRDCLNAQIYRHKAIKAVSISASQSIVSTMDTLRHLVAMNLMVLFETLASYDSRREWGYNICYVKNTSIARYATDQMHTGDSALVLHWVYYFDVISKFSVKHQMHSPQSSIECAKQFQLTEAAMNSTDDTSIVPTLGCSLEVWHAISTLMHILLNSMDDDEGPPPEALSKVERRLKYAKQVIKVEELDKIQQTLDIAELWRLAGLIYLHRAGYNATTASASLQALTESASAVLTRLYTCERTFPLFIVACEARTDVQRATVLSLIDVTRSFYTPTNITRVHRFIERFWALDDLDVGQETTYSEKLTAVMSTGYALPAFV